MTRTSTSSSRAKGRSARIEPTYRKCPLCGSGGIELGSEHLKVSRRNGRCVTVQVRRWRCPDCGESFLTRDSRRRLDQALGLRTTP